MKRRDINWRQKKIRFVQQKTGIPLTLPLSAEFGNAIAEYILESRPKVDAPQLFLNCQKPYDMITPDTIQK